MDESVISIAELKRRLPRQVNHNTLITILEYLEISNKIMVTMQGITWIHNPTPNLQKAIAEDLSYENNTRKTVPGSGRSIPTSQQRSH